MRVKSSGTARGWQMPCPRAVQNLQMPHPETDKSGKCPAVAWGGWVQVELTDALEREDKNLKKTKLKTAGFSGEKRGVYFLG